MLREFPGVKVVGQLGGGVWLHNATHLFSADKVTLFAPDSDPIIGDNELLLYHATNQNLTSAVINNDDLFDSERTDQAKIRLNVYGEVSVLPISSSFWFYNVHVCPIPVGRCTPLQSPSCSRTWFSVGNFLTMSVLFCQHKGQISLTKYGNWTNSRKIYFSQLAGVFCTRNASDHPQPGSGQGLHSRHQRNDDPATENYPPDSRGNRQIFTILQRSRQSESQRHLGFM